MEQSLKTTS